MDLKMLYRFVQGRIKDLVFFLTLIFWDPYLVPVLYTKEHSYTINTYNNSLKIYLNLFLFVEGKDPE